MIPETPEIWWVTGSQHLYGPETLEKVKAHSETMVKQWNASGRFPFRIVFKGVLTHTEAITERCQQANATPSCVGLLAWMHTFSPSKMWMQGIRLLDKPLCHLHTQFHTEIPWGEIDMDFMNLNQAAHGDREFGYMLTHLNKARKTVVGHWEDPEVMGRVAVWSRAAYGCEALRGLKVARIGDNMRQVAVTEGDKVAAQLKFGMSVEAYDTDDLLGCMPGEGSSAIEDLAALYEAEYEVSPELKRGGARHDALLEAARIELGIRQFMQTGGFGAITDTFENLGGLRQLPGIAVQRLMADGYGFAAEGDWKTAGLLYAMKTMARGLEGGTSFMEDYTYHFEGGKGYVLGSHMLEICPSIAAGKPSCEIHPLAIGNREDPVRLVFTAGAGPALNASLVDLGGRFRLLANQVMALPPREALPNLPTPRAFWEPLPDLKTSAGCWLAGGGSHHTVYTQALTLEYLEDFADFFDIELLCIDAQTRLADFNTRLRANAAYFGRKQP
ncbi:L-arabinose isomerase [Robiginitalea sediminis]|uniref:L-arabinose isomerase n=1 Tax=Robiginitalea sediminis TaxID=1982593 RepID=UPI000B4BB729|nr:L-arabinose isomerase [Robiginitalea sediminis]